MVLMLAGLLLGLASVRSRTVSGTPLADSQAQCASAQLTAVSAQWRRADVFGVRDSRIFHAHLNPDAPAKREVTYFAGGKAEGKKVQWRPTAIASLNETGRVDVFYTTEDFQLYHKWLDGDTFQPDASDESLGENLNGSFRATVSATSFKPNQIDLIAQGGHDLAYYYRGFEDGKWQPDDWASIGGSFWSPPTSVRVGREVHVFGLSNVDFSIKHKTWDGTRWLPSQLGWDDTPAGRFQAVPRAVSWGDDRLDVFVATEAGMQHCAWIGPAHNCTGWGSVGPVNYNTQPSVAAVRNGTYEMLYPYITTEGRLAYARKAFQDKQVSDWLPQPNYFVSEPAVTAMSNRSVVWFALAQQADNVSLATRGWNGEAYWPTEDQWGFLGTVATGENGTRREGMELVGQKSGAERLNMELK